MIRYLVTGAVGLGLGFALARAVPGPAARAPTELPGDSSAAAAAAAAAAADGIAALHRADSAATVSGDPVALAALWDSAGVRQEPGSPATVTRAAMLAADTRFRAAHPGSGIVRYVPHVLGLAVHGDWAVEWGYFDSEWVAGRGARPEAFRGNLLRVLRRQSDGTWKFSHVMWNHAQ